MNLIIIAVVAVLASTLAIFIDRRNQGKKKELPVTAEEQATTETTDATVEETEASSGKSGPLGRISSWSQRVTKGSKTLLAEQFQSWAGTNIDDVQLKNWLTELSPKANKALTEQLNDFCANLGFELSWLLDDTLEKDPEIEREARQVVIAYCTACWHAAQSYNDFELFKTMQEIEKQAFTREHKSLSRRLFTELVKRDMAASVPAELFVASEKERQEHMANAIRQAAETDREAFKAVLKEVMLTEGEVETTDPISTNGQSPAATESTSEAESKKTILPRMGRKKPKADESSEPESPAPTTPDTTQFAPDPSTS
ncbi:MAG: hypothetical protein HC837_02490 [Chloroflexaceae bacterium]|nr:hypothetical protein [Chloroflexaceae bacterium]